MPYDRLGTFLAATGSIISLSGSVANNLFLSPVLARQIWVVANPLLLAWAIGLKKQWWHDGLGVDAVVGMYLFNTVTGILSFVTL